MRIRRCMQPIRAAALGAMLFVAYALAAPSTAAAQAVGQISGTARDTASGAGIPGVQVLVVGTRLTAVADASGKYSISGVPVGTHTIQFRRVGFGPRDVSGVTVTAGGTATVNAALTAIALQLEAVVTTGVVDPTSGTRVPFTVGHLDMANAPVPHANPMETLQGKMAGVTTLTDGQPGSGTNVLLRSPTSINKSNSPLIVVDGVIQTQAFGASTADLESMDIESVEVVKGAAAASLYGSRASSGVISIRTRRAADMTLGATRVTARSEAGQNSLGNEIPWSRYHSYMVNASGQYINAAGAVVPRSQRVADSVFRRFQDKPFIVPIYNQVNAFFHPGGFYKNSVNIGQNTGRTNWFGSFVNSKEDGVILGHGGYGENAVRLNLDHRPTDNLTLSFSGYHMRAQREEIGDPFFPLINQSSDVNLRVPDADGTPYVFQADSSEGREANPLYTLYNTSDWTKRARTQGGIEARYRPLGWLGFDANVSYDRSDRRENYFLDAGVKTGTYPTGSPGEISEFSGTTDALNSAASANLTWQLGSFNVRSTVRGLMERETNQTTTAGGTILSAPGVRSLNNAQSRTVSSATTEIRSLGYFATLGADYDGKYIFDGLVRRDGSSLFGEAERWHSYYRVSGSYRISQEPWWPFPAFNEFKLRASRGTAGGRPSFNDQFETYAFTAGGGLGKSTLGNRFLKPELSTETEVGIDAIFRDRVSLQLSYARNRVQDQLVAIPLAKMYGYPSQWQNAGTVEGNTIEGTIEAQIVARPRFEWRLGLVADRSRNKITEFDRSCFTTNTIAYRCAGETLGAMYGFLFMTSPGQLPAEAAARGSEFQLNDEGLLVWVGPGNKFTEGETKRLWGTTATIGSANYGWGMPITQIDSVGNPRVAKIGDGNPVGHFGVSNDITWRGLRVYALVDVQMGGDVYNQTRQRMYQYGRHHDVDQAGKPQDLKKPVDYYVSLYNASNIVNYFVENAGFVKLREISLTYQFPNSLLRPLARAGVKGAQLSIIGRNLLTFTRYKGYDPEVFGANPLVRLDSYSYPRYRTVTSALQVNF